MISADIVILGGGIAGVSLPAELVGATRFALLERDSRLGRHYGIQPVAPGSMAA